MKKIILADNQEISRIGMARLLHMKENFCVVRQCADHDYLSRSVDAFHGSVVLIAASLQADLQALAGRLAKAGSRAIVILEDNQSPAHFQSMGIGGLVYRNVSAAELIGCVHRVTRGECIQSPFGSSLRFREVDQVGARVRDLLTKAEMKVIAMITQGCKNKEIAGRLGTTEQVVKNYLRAIFDKMGVSDRVELALFTIHHSTLAAAAAASDQMMYHDASKAIARVPVSNGVRGRRSPLSGISTKVRMVALGSSAQSVAQAFPTGDVLSRRRILHA